MIMVINSSILNNKFDLSWYQGADVWFRIIGTTSILFREFLSPPISFSLLFKIIEFCIVLVLFTPLPTDAYNLVDLLDLDLSELDLIHDPNNHLKQQKFWYTKNFPSFLMTGLKIFLFKNKNLLGRKIMKQR